VTGHEGALIAFLGGELDAAEAARFDAHLLDCDSCWQAVTEDRLGRVAVERLRDTAPPGLTDRIRFAVELARPPAARQRRALVQLLAAVAVLAALLLVPGLTHRHQTDPPTVAAVVQLARYMPRSTEVPGESKPVPLGAPLELRAGGHRLSVQYYRVRGHEIVIATSDRAFAMPVDGRNVTPGRGMAWLAQRGPIGLYCPEKAHTVLIAAAMPAAELHGLDSQLPLP
jgi:hypothetical protein